MPRKLKVFATAMLPPHITLKRPIMTAAPNVEAAAKALKVSRYHLARHPFPLSPADRARALAKPLERLVAEASQA